MEEFPTSKRDKRRYNMAARLRLLNESFDSEREAYYNKMLYNLQKSLYELHNGVDPEFQEQLADLEEHRDNRLTELALWEQYQLDQAQKQYEEDVEAATAGYEHMMQLVKDKLRTRLEAQRKQLAEDRTLVDVANDHSFFLQAANPKGISTSTSGGVNSHHYNSQNSQHGLGAISALGGLTSAERRSLRRRGNAHSLSADEMSGVSGNESGSTRRRGATSGAAGSGQDSDAYTSTNNGGDALDAVLRDLDRPQQRHITKSYQGVKTLRNDEGLNDLAQIGEAARRIRRQFGYTR